MGNIFQDENKIPIGVLLDCATNEYLSSDESQLKKLKKVSFIKIIINEDSELKSEEIFQAIRNVWIMNSLQIFWRLKLQMMQL